MIDFFTTGFGIAIGVFLIALTVSWIALPFVVIGKLGSINKRMTAIEKNTADIARFFNERDVKIE